MKVNREELAARQAAARAQLEQLSAAPGLQGVMARLGAATLGLDDWTVGEMERGTPNNMIVAAAAQRAASMLATHLVNLSPADPAERLRFRDAARWMFEQTLDQIITDLETATQAQRAALSVTLHPQQ